jgi:hypothetical protein
MTDVKVTPRKKRKRARVSDDPTRTSSRSAGAISRATGKACTRCGVRHLQVNSTKASCNGHLRRARPYKPCRRPPIPGGEVCDRHGGQFTVVKANAARRVAWENTEGEVGRLLAECDIPNQHPIDGLLEAVRYSGAMMRLLATLCSQLDLEIGEIKVSFNEVGTATRYTTKENSLYGLDHTGDGAPHVLVVMFGQWQDRYMRACKLALDANIDERLVRNAESTTDALYAAVSVALGKANLDPQQQAAFSSSLADELRRLVGPLDTMKKVGA